MTWVPLVMPLTSTEIAATEARALALIEEIKASLSVSSEGGKTLTVEERKQIGRKALNLVALLVIDLLD